MSRSRCFPHLTDHNTRVLILGSLPGRESLRLGQYYANRRNQFWRLAGAVIGAGEDFADSAYEARVSGLLDAGVGLWDVIASAERPGSLDARIRDHEPNALAELAASLQDLQAIAFNGGTAAKLGRPILESAGKKLVLLPSSSPALTRPYEVKLAAWREELEPFLP
jgi:hypoxanthine-DNA glycosylase